MDKKRRSQKKLLMSFAQFLIS